MDQYRRYALGARRVFHIAGLGNPTSKLIYKDVGTNVVELTGNGMVHTSMFGRLNFGIAGIGGGDSRTTTIWINGGQRSLLATHQRFNRRRHVVCECRQLASAHGEFPNHRGWLDVFGGFQFWHTKYKARWSTQVDCTTAGSTVDLGGVTASRRP